MRVVANYNPKMCNPSSVSTNYHEDTIAALMTTAEVLVAKLLAVDVYTMTTDVLVLHFNIS